LLSAVIGGVPDVDEYWRPKFEDFLNGREKIEKIIDEESSIETIFENASTIFYEKETKAIAGREIPALPPSKQNVETKADDEINS
jgi:hypothetical protein